MNDGINSINEAEFIKQYILWCSKRRGSTTIFYGTNAVENAIKQIDGFLEMFHKHFYEVEFVRKELESDDAYGTYELRS